MKTKLFLIMALVIFLGQGCKKKYPTASTSGKQIFACKIDGKPFVADGKTEKPTLFTGGGIGCLFYANNLSSSKFTLYGQFGYSDNQMYINFSEVPNTVGDYNISSNLVNSINYFPVRDITVMSPWFNTKPGINGNLHISKVTNEFFSGTFSCTLTREDGKTISITDGIFDVQK